MTMDPSSLSLTIPVPEPARRITDTLLIPFLENSVSRLRTSSVSAPQTPAPQDPDSLPALQERVATLEAHSQELNSLLLDAIAVLVDCCSHRLCFGARNLSESAGVPPVSCSGNSPCCICQDIRRALLL